MKYTIIGITCILFFTKCSQDKKETDHVPQTKTQPTYPATKIEQGGLVMQLKLPAQLAAYEEVNIFPKVNAYVKTVSVEIGDKVSRGKLLLTLEAPELDQAVQASKEKYLRTVSDFKIDQEHYQRLLEASKTEGAISPYDLSALNAKVRADSILSIAEKANFEMQKSMMGYLRVLAPFDGMITERNVHPGALVSAAVKDKPMLQLKQIQHLRLQIDVPESMATQIQVGDSIAFYTSAFPGKKNIGIVSRKANDINLQLRSMRMEIDVFNPDGVLAPGMYADVILVSKGSPHAFNVPKSAVVISTERKYIILTKNGIRTKMDVITRNESMDKIEIFGAFNVSDSVIIHASDEIK